MGRRRPGEHPYDYTAGDDRRFLDSGVGGTLRVLHGPGRGMGVPEGVVCRVEVGGADGALLDEAEAGRLGKEHRRRGTAPRNWADVTVSASCTAAGELTAERIVVLTGDLADVVRSGVGPCPDQMAGVDAGELPRGPATLTSRLRGAGVPVRGARPAWTPDPPDAGCGRR